MLRNVIVVFAIVLTLESSALFNTAFTDGRAIRAHFDWTQPMSQQTHFRTAHAVPDGDSSAALCSLIFGHKKRY